jgi:hypothetical protein
MSRSRIIYCLWKNLICPEIKRAPWGSVILLGIISVLTLYLADQMDDKGIFLLLSKGAWQAVTSGLVASFAFAVLQTLGGIVKSTNDQSIAAMFNDLTEKHGVLAAFNQRGSGDATERYRTLLKKENCRRIWAWGMTNKHFVEQHIDSIVEILNNNQSADVVIAFWSPTTKMELGSVQTTVIDFQCRMEGGAASDWLSKIRERQKTIRDRMGNIKGEIRIYEVSTPAAFSCMLIDSTLFFFPFLTKSDSTSSPMVQCSIIGDVGKAIYRHLDYLWDPKCDASQLIFHRKSTDVIKDFE